MPIDATVIGGLAGLAGIVLGKLGDVLITRLTSSATAQVGLTQHMNEQSKLLFEQQNVVITSQWARIDAAEEEARVAETRAQVAEGQLGYFKNVERERDDYRAKFDDCAYRLAMALAGYTLDDEPAYPLPRVRRPLPPPRVVDVTPPPTGDTHGT
jgi:hypothetical protein